MLGTTISHYKLLDTLGSGGMGVVYRAEDTRLGRQVALKCLPAELAANPQAVERLLREARSAATLNHPNICTIHEVDQADGHHFITMELLEGQTLRERIAAGPIETSETIRLALQIADALDAAHKKSIIHRDIKPANIFITDRGDAKVLDFGLAKLEGALLPHGASLTAATLGAEPLHLTSPGQAVGTISYMSPEQARGLAVDVRTDLFSLGAVLYEMAAGQPAFPGTTSAVIFDAILNRQPVAASRLGGSPALDPIIAKLLEKDCRLRYQSASDLLADLRRLQRDAISTKVSAGSARSSERGAARAKKRASGKAVDSLAVLPFVNATGSADMDYLGEAIAEGVIDTLSRLPRLRVVPRNKSFRLRDRADDPQSAGHELDVRAVLTGRLTMRGAALNIRAELIDVAQDAQLWGAQITRPAEDLAAIQDEISRGIANKLAGPSSSGVAPAPRTAATAEAAQAARVLIKAAESAGTAAESREARQLYMRGSHHAHKWTEEGLQRGIELYRQAIDVDPLYAQAYAAMAVAYAVTTITAPRGDLQDSYRSARACARRAIELDDALGEAHSALGIVHLWCDLDVAAALREGKRGFDLSPDSAVTHYLYAMALACDTRLDEAAEIARLGFEMDPLMTPITYCYGLILNYQRRWSEAEAQLRRTLDVAPHFVVARAVLSIVLARAGLFEEALKEADEVMKSDAVAPFRSVRAYIAALVGDQATARAMLADSVLMSSSTAGYFAAATWGVLGELDRGFIELERARDMRFSLITTAAVNPTLDPYRSDPRWPAFLRSLNLRTGPAS